MALFDVLKKRHSIRKYTGEKVSRENLEKIIQAGLLSASSRSLRPWQLTVITNKEILRAMPGCRTGGANMLAGADACIMVTADPEVCDVWIEDCSIVMSNMHLMAESLGVGSCWIQGRLRTAEDGRSTEEYLAELVGIPEGHRLEAILSIGMPAENKPETNIDDLRYDKVRTVE
ncbi:MAG: nitroreductase family protein [Bacillota bacterium]|nr:nitroreductase family protein [Bacillota bacterium]